MPEKTLLLACGLAALLASGCVGEAPAPTDLRPFAGGSDEPALTDPDEAASDPVGSTREPLETPLAPEDHPKIKKACNGGKGPCDGVVCAAAHAAASCVNGACVITSCDAGFGDCDGVYGDGCEAALGGDAGNCGACGHACPKASGCSLAQACVSGACAVVGPKPNGTPCSDGNACTQVDQCSFGVCLGKSVAPCAASDQCHYAGSCDPGLGACSNVAKPDGTPCDDGNPATTQDGCVAGVCAGGGAPPPPVCATASRDFEEEAPLHPGGLVESCDLATPQGGWLDVTACRAPGDPDWSGAFNAAISLVLAGKIRSHTIFVPSGSYPVAHPINVHGYGVRILGEDPATTTLVWTGAPYVVSGARPGYPDVGYLTPAARAQRSWMFLVDSAFEAEIRRLTLDGAGSAEAAIRQANFSNNGQGYGVCGDTICAASESAASCPKDCPQDPTLHLEQYSSATQSRFSDLVIKDFARGIWGGLAGGAQDDTTLVLRVRFSEIGQAWVPAIGKPITSLAAVAQTSQNALAWDVQNCAFDHVVSGLWASASSAVSVNAWNNAFQHSTLADVVASGTSFYELRGNTSYQSKRFVLANGFAPGLAVDEDGYTGNGSAGGPGPLMMTIEDNVILDPTCPGGDVTCAPIDLRTTGGYSVVDNVIRTTAAPAIRFPKAIGFTTGASPNFEGVPVILLGNQFSLPQTAPGLADQDNNAWWQVWLDSTQAFYPPVPTINAYKNLDNVRADLAALAPPPLVMATPVMRGREVYNVVTDLTFKQQSVGTTVPDAACGQSTHLHGAALSAWISQNLTGHSRPFLYFPAGCYSMDDASLVIPGGLDVQLVGDGPTTRFLAGSADYIFRLLAPARATLRDLAVLGTSVPGAVQINSFDSSGDQVYFSGSFVYSKGALPSQPFPAGDPHVALAVEGVDRTRVRADHSSFSAANTAVRVVGGGAAQAGAALTKGLQLLGSFAGGSTAASYKVASWGKIVAQAGETEETWGIDLRNSSGYLTLTGTRYLVDAVGTAADWTLWAAAYPISGAVYLDGFHGNVSFLSMQTGLAFHAPTVAPAGDPGFGLYFIASQYWDSVDAVDSVQFTPATPVAPLPAGGATASFEQRIDCTPAVNLPSYARGAILEATLAGVSQYSHYNGPGTWQCQDVSTNTGESAALRAAYADLRASKVATPKPACALTSTDVVLDHLLVNPNDTTLPTGTVRVQRVTPPANK